MDEPTLDMRVALRQSFVSRACATRPLMARRFRPRSWAEGRAWPRVVAQVLKAAANVAGGGRVGDCYRAGARGGRWADQGRACSKAAAARRHSASSCQPVTTCRAMGKPSEFTPHGSEAAG